MLDPANRAMLLQVAEEEGFLDSDPRGDVPPVDGFEAFGDQSPGDEATYAVAAPVSSAGSLNEWDAGEFVDMPPPREWLLGNQFCRRFLSGLLAPGATGKTALRTLQYLALATGRPLTGQHVFKRCRVLLLSLEDDDSELQRRLAAARIHHGIEPADLKGWLFCATPKGIKLADMKDGARAAGPLEAMLRQVIAARQIDLLGLDPFVKLHGMEENDNGAMDFVCGILVKLAIEFNIAVDVPHHTKKGQQLAGDADAGRGASAARDAGRLMYTLTRMADGEGEAFGVPAEERRLYVRLDSSKVNIAPPSAEATWFKLVGVRLENGTPDYPQGDEVQTVVPWSPPKTWDGISAAQLNAALDDIETGMPSGQRYSDASKAADRAAWQVVQRHCPDRTEPQCRDIVKTWVKNGVLIREDYADPVTRKPLKGLRVCQGKRPT
ncbi:AAA family ATPase [Bradyrhizobium cajani]|uniref:AAA family ATPase n=1 Tax=Bradyrhizobium cajani TaxID=1928661 RepID=A0A844TA26_9BRAD|nr:AAA family ATPase [Bradyrhizobium cajani]MCP3370772.1 helicase RepA family protein [Bradyrhizobium cajani]MVT75877.1 AAA family ATPase [Bradyrhizobium cajani]